MKVKDYLLENMELHDTVERQKKFIKALKMSNAKLTLERNRLIEENMQLKNQINKNSKYFEECIL